MRNIEDMLNEEFSNCTHLRLQATSEGAKLDFELYRNGSDNIFGFLYDYSIGPLQGEDIFDLAFYMGQASFLRMNLSNSRGYLELDHCNGTNNYSSYSGLYKDVSAIVEQGMEPDKIAALHELGMQDLGHSRTRFFLQAGNDDKRIEVFYRDKKDIEHYVQHNHPVKHMGFSGPGSLYELSWLFDGYNGLDFSNLEIIHAR